MGKYGKYSQLDKNTTANRTFRIYCKIELAYLHIHLFTHLRH
jgi:hypothetical protein